MTLIIVDQNIGHNLIEYVGHVKPKKKARGFVTRALCKWRRGTGSNCRYGDFQTKFYKIYKCCDYKRLILFQFFSLFLVSFGTVWKYLTLTGTIWAQSYSIRPFQNKQSQSFLPTLFKYRPLQNKALQYKNYICIYMIIKIYYFFHHV